MDLTNTKPVIISAGIGSWYGKGVERLRRSLNFVGWPGETLTWINSYPPETGDKRHESVPYYFKIAAFEYARKRGYTHVLWLDASFWAVKNPVPLFDILVDQGYWMFSSGYNLAQTCNDRALEALDLKRDMVSGANEWATGCVGINFENPDGVKLYSLWKEYMDMGLSVGRRDRNNEESQDPRFLHHRQDQTCFSLACYKLGLKNERGLDHVAYYGTNYSVEDVIFFIQGL